MKKVLKPITALGCVISICILGALAGIAYAFLEMRTRFRLMLGGVSREGIIEVTSGEGPQENRSMDEITGVLEEIPFRPVEPMALGVLRALVYTSFLLFLNAKRSTAGRIYPYPCEFEEVTFESFDGTPLVGALGLHQDGLKRPGLVISHGFMGSKNDHYVIDTALKAFSGWGFNVLAVDLRNFGRSQELSHSPTTAGWKEGEDLLAAARYLGGFDCVTTVGITGFSMGAGSTIRAAYLAGEYPYLTGGAIAWNGYADSLRMVRYLSSPPRFNSGFYPFFLSFKLMHWLRRRDMLSYIEDPEMLEYLKKPFAEADFASYVRKIAAPHYGVEEDQVYEGSSCVNYLRHVKVPLLVVHAVDDPVCPISEIDDLIDIARENPWVHIWVLPAGGHCMFRYFDEDWSDRVMKEFFTYWGSWE